MVMDPYDSIEDKRVMMRQFVIWTIPTCDEQEGNFPYASQASSNQS